MSQVPDETRLTFVTVVYEREWPLLTLQARSLGRYVDPTMLSELVVVDNSSPRMTARQRDGLLIEYGSIAPMVRFVAADDVADVLRVEGYRSQQVLKLKIAEQINTDRYVVLDAKNHAIAPVSREWFVARDGRIRVTVYSYESHPLRGALERILTYFDLPIRHVQSFTATATPFTMDRRAVIALIRAVEERSGMDFATEFVSGDLKEFLLYTCWLLASGHNLDQHYQVHYVNCPVVWPHSADRAGIEKAIEAAGPTRPLFAVHREALARLKEDAIGVLGPYWVERGLFPSVGDALAFITDFQRWQGASLWIKQLREAP